MKVPRKMMLLMLTVVGVVGLVGLVGGVGDVVDVVGVKLVTEHFAGGWHHLLQYSRQSKPDCLMP